MNYVPQTESDDLLYSGRRGMPGWDGRHHGAVHSQVESSLQDEENSKTFRGQTRPSWRGQGETMFQSGHYMYCTGQLCRDTRRSLGRTLPSSICVGGSTTSSCPSSQSTGERRTSSRSREEIVKPWGPRTIIHFTSPATLMAAMAENLA